METFLVTVVCYLIMGLLIWVALPTLEDASGERPKLWKTVLIWGPVVFLPRSGQMFKAWMWRKPEDADMDEEDDTGFDLGGMISGDDDEGIENGDHNGV